MPDAVAGIFQFVKKQPGLDCDIYRPDIVARHLNLHYPTGSKELFCLSGTYQTGSAGMLSHPPNSMKLFLKQNKFFRSGMTE
jgi:hypothetical protein